MKSHHEPNNIDEEASLWAARLEGGGLDDQGQIAFTEWLAASPDHRKAYDRYRDLSARIGSHLDAQLGEAVGTVVQLKTASRRRRRRLAGVLTAAAMIAVVFAARIHRSQDFTTKTGERHMATLDDGSKVELNARTTLTVSFGREERRVRLANGEALFTVTKDTQRPFVVETATGSVRVTGTVFDVRAASARQVEVTVLEGTVRVRVRDESPKEQAVTAGSQAVLGEKSLIVRRLADGEALDIIAWQQGQVVFNDTSLSSAIDRFAAYHARNILVDTGAASLTLGGRYSLDDLNGFLESIETVLPVHVSHLPNETIRISVAGDPAK